MKDINRMKLFVDLFCGEEIQIPINMDLFETQKKVIGFLCLTDQAKYCSDIEQENIRSNIVKLTNKIYDIAYENERKGLLTVQKSMSVYLEFIEKNIKPNFTFFANQGPTQTS